MNQIDEIDRFANELRTKADNGEKINLADLNRSVADAVLRPTLYKEKERIRAGCYF